MRWLLLLALLLPACSSGSPPGPPLPAAVAAAQPTPLPPLKGPPLPPEMEELLTRKAQEQLDGVFGPGRTEVTLEGTAWLNPHPHEHHCEAFVPAGASPQPTPKRTVRPRLEPLQLRVTVVVREMKPDQISKVSGLVGGALGLNWERGDQVILVRGGTK